MASPLMVQRRTCLRNCSDRANATANNESQQN
jgi:hypothetical protein